MKMDVTELLNANLSKKMGIGMLAMYLISQTTDISIALTIAAVAIYGVTCQTLVDYKKPKTPKGE